MGALRPTASGAGVAGGLELSQEDRQRPYVEVSGRKGLGVKADDLIDTLIAKALEEVRSRQMTQDIEEQQTYACMIAVAALIRIIPIISTHTKSAFTGGIEGNRQIPGC